MVTSSGYYYGYTYMDDGLYFFRRQFLWLAVGLAALVACRIMPLWWFKQQRGSDIGRHFSAARWCW